MTAIWSKRRSCRTAGLQQSGGRHPRADRLTWRTRRAANGRQSLLSGGPAEDPPRLAHPVSYAAQCCGVSVDYQVVNVAPYGVGIQTDHRFNFSFTLAGIGTFTNPLGSFGR